jgi:serine phosphatase RsbU (regulator of sigma subunit)
MDAITLSGTLDPLNSLREYVRAASREFGLNDDSAGELILAADDIFANRIFHGQQEGAARNDILVEAFSDGDDLVIQLTENGDSYHPEVLPARREAIILQHESTACGSIYRLIVPRRPLSEPATSTAQDERRKLQTLLTVAESLGREIQLDALLKLMVAEVTKAMMAERSTLFLVDRKKPDELVSRVAEGAQEIRVPFGVGIAGATARSRGTINVPDAYKDSRFNQAFDKSSGFRTRNILSVPLIGQNGRLIGVVQVLNKKGGEAFTREDERFLDSICVHFAIALQRAEMVEAYLRSQVVAESLELAREIQMGLVPRNFPALPQFREIDIFAAIVPALEVGGDLYDFFTLDQDRICFIIGDVSDKGIPAALFMAMVRATFKMAAIAAPESIALTMNRVNQFLCESNPQQMFVTALAGILDLRTGHVDYVDAGHEPPFIRHADGTVQKVDKAGNIVLGLLPDYAFASGELQLAAGDNLVLYTDGVTEAMDAGHQLFGADRLEMTLSCAGHPADSEAVIRALLDDLRAHVGQSHQSDDITLLAIRYLGRQSRAEPESE